MKDYDLLKKAHNSLPASYKEVMVPYLTRYATYLVEGGNEQDDRAKKLFEQYWVGYKIYHFQQKGKDFEFWDLMDQGYEFQRELAVKIYEQNK